MRPSASAKALVWSASTDGRSPTDRCSPFDPDVFTTACRPSCPSTSRRSTATRAQSRTSAGAPGSRSNTIAVGRSGSSARACGVCSSSAARLATHTSPGRSSIAHDAIVGAGVEGHGVQPVGSMARAALLEEALALDAVGQAHHREWAAVQVGEQHRGDPGVVVDDLAFGEARGGVQHLLQVRESEPAAADLYPRGRLAARGLGIWDLGPGCHDLRR